MKRENKKQLAKSGAVAKGGDLKRHLNLNFFGIHFPLTAWVSIAHRLSGLCLFLLIPVLLWGLQTSLKSVQTFNALKVFLRQPWCIGVVLILLAALTYHTVAGIRHLLMDAHIGLKKETSLISARLLIVIALIFFIGLCKRFLC
jgi:succinate dehydrogenase / fumarate reductase cytochrome b subunit